MTDIPLVDKEEVIAEKNAKIPTWKRQGFNGRLEWANHNAQLEGYKSEAEKYKIKRWEQGKKVPLQISNTPAQKGDEMENYLSQLYGKLERMPYGNRGYDFICRKDKKKIEVKRRQMTSYPDSKVQYFDFTHIDYNKEADIFIFVGIIGSEPVKIWKFDKKDILEDNLPIWARERLLISNKPSCFDIYRNYELPTKLEDLKKLIGENNVSPLKRINIDDMVNYEKEIVKEKKNEIIENITSQNKNIKYRTLALELELIKNYLSPYFEDIRDAYKDPSTGKKIFYNLTGIDKKNGKKVKINHIGRCLGFAKNCNYSRWPVGIENNDKTDYFVISLWEDRDKIIPMKILLIHKDEIIRNSPFWKRSGITITNTLYKLREFKKYEIQIESVAK